MNKSILVTYATRAGSTVEVATAIGKTLSQRGYPVDIKSIKENPQVDDYQAVVVGSAIRMGQWLPEAIRFLETQQLALHQVPTAFFTVHILNIEDDETSRKNRLAYLDPVKEILVPQHEEFFTGKVDPSQLSFFEQTITKTANSPEGDLRDWDKIRSWANTLL